MSARHVMRRLLSVSGIAGLASLALAERRRLSASQRRFHALANSGAALIRQDGIDGVAVYFNEPWLAFTRRPLAELIGDGWLQDVHPLDRGLLQATRRVAASRHTATTVEYRLRRHDGEYRWMIEHSSPYRLDHGEIEGSISSLIDISDHKRAEAGLRLLASTGAVITSSLATSEMLDRFTRHVTQSFASCCAVHLLQDGVLRLASVASSSSELQDATAIALRTREHEFNHLPLVARLQDERDPILIDDRQRAELDTLRRELGLPDDQLLSSLVIASLTLRGRSIGTMLMTTQAGERPFDARDLGLVRSLAQRLVVVLENARLFEEAQAAEERYRRFFSGSADAIVVADTSLTVRESNPAFARLYGADDAASSGRSLLELLHLPHEVVEQVRSGRSDHEWRGNTTLVRHDGSHVAVEVWLGGMQIPDGPIIVATLRDISERASFEESRRKLLASVSHDLKNPLNSIKANAQLARRQIARGAIDMRAAAEIFERIDGLTNRMSRQIADLMDVALLEAGSKLELDLQPVDLVAMARLVVEQYRATTTQHQIEIVTGLESLVIEGDRHRLERVLTNLLTNAIKYSPNGGLIEVIIRHRQIDRDGSEWAEIAVSDQGIGIDPEDRKTLFTRIGRGRNVSERISGTGIGLVGVSQILQQHGGSIGVESVPGQGSTFRITLPIDGPASEEPDAGDPPTV